VGMEKLCFEAGVAAGGEFTPFSKIKGTHDLPRERGGEGE